MANRSGTAAFDLTNPAGRLAARPAALGGLLALVALVWIFAGRGLLPIASDRGATPTPTATDSYEPPVLGKSTAPVTIVEYGDFQ